METSSSSWASGRCEWRVHRRGSWTYATPDAPPREQGWKLHVSATLASAKEVLRRAVPVLIDAGTPFKVASTAADLASLNSSHCPRPSSGKFMTVYPPDDDQAVVLMGRSTAPPRACQVRSSSLIAPTARAASSIIATGPSKAGPNLERR